MFNVVIWGMGADFWDSYNLLQTMKDAGQIDLKAYVDQNPKDNFIDNVPVITPQDVVAANFDYLIVMSRKYFKEILEKALQLGIERAKMIDGKVLKICGFQFDKYVSLLKNPPSIISNFCSGGGNAEFVRSSV